MRSSPYKKKNGDKTRDPIGPLIVTVNETSKFPELAQSQQPLGLQSSQDNLFPNAAN